MTTTDQMFRRNFTVAAMLHVALISSVVLYEVFVHPVRKMVSTAVELVTPADILGDMPKGSGTGRGAYTPPVEQPAPPAPLGESIFTPEERAVPQPKPAPVVAQPTSNPNDILIPKKPKTTTTQKPAPVATAQRATTNAKPTGSTAKSTAKSGSASAADIRNRLAQALQATAGGTPYGDGRAPGGGSGKSSVIGSPDGLANGVANGVGKGSPFWWYYQQVHDRMYEAWEQPGEALSGDRNVVAVIVIHVLPDGKVTEVSLKHSSGNKLMDDSALSAARKVTKLDPPPPGVPSSIDVDFQLERGKS